MALPQGVVTFAFIHIVIFFATIAFIVIVSHEKFKQRRLKQDSSQNLPGQLLYSRFLILFEILLVSQFLFFIESVWIVWIHFTGWSLIPLESNYYFSIQIPLIDGSWVTTSLSAFVSNIGSGVAISYLYFYYDNYFCQFRMKGIPALVNLGVIIVNELSLYYLNPVIISGVLSTLSLVAIGLVCIDLFISRKSVPNVDILLMSLISAFIFGIIVQIITLSIIPDIMMSPSTSEDTWQYITLFSLTDLVRHVVYYSIIVAGMLVFLRKLDLALNE